MNLEHWTVHYTSVSVWQVADFVTHQAVKEDGLLPTWQTQALHPSRTPARDPPGGPSTGPQQPPSTSVRDPSGRPPTWKRSRGSGQPPPGAAGQGPSEGADQPGTPQSVLAADPFGHVVRYSKEAIRLEEAAATLEQDMIKGVLGRGALGAVFEARWGSGHLVFLWMVLCIWKVLR